MSSTSLRFLRLWGKLPHRGYIVLLSEWDINDSTKLFLLSIAMTHVQHTALKNERCSVP